jgi:hypothetical protein
MDQGFIVERTLGKNRSNEQSNDRGSLGNPRDDASDQSGDNQQQSSRAHLKSLLQERAIYDLRV